MSDDDLPVCDRCEMPMRNYIAGTGICLDCHDLLYGKGHRPAAVLRTEVGWFPYCIKPNCPVLDGLTMLHYGDAHEATETSRRLHKEAIHGPEERR